MKRYLSLLLITVMLALPAMAKKPTGDCHENCPVTNTTVINKGSNTAVIGGIIGAVAVVAIVAIVKHSRKHKN